MKKEELVGISFIGKSVLELMVRWSPTKQTIDICEKFKGTCMEDFNPLNKTSFLNASEESKDPLISFQKRLDKIIIKNKGPIGLMKIIRNSSVDLIKRFTEDEKNKDLSKWEEIVQDAKENNIE